MSVPVVDGVLLAALREDFAGLDFSVDGLADFLGEDGVLAWQQDRRVPLLRCCAVAGGSLLSLAVRFFLLGVSLPAESVGELLPHCGARGLVALGLAEPAGDLLRPLVHLAPHAASISGVDYHWWVASDLGALAGVRPAVDHVLGVGGATRTLALATPPGRVGSALDLGTGCGVLALYLATHSRRVVASDISARACAFAAFNVALNGFSDRVEVCRGDLCAPVDGEFFDLIVSNPPFVITADRVRESGVFEYRDGGRAGDELTAEVVGQVCEHLAPGGHAVLLGNWEVRSAGQWMAGPQRWLEGREVAAWVVQRRLLSPAQYVRLWLEDGSAGQGTAGSESVELAWLEDFASRGVVGIGMGLVVLAAPGSRGFVPARRFDVVETSSSAAGEFLQGAVDLLASGWSLSRADRLVRAADVREERHYVPGQPDPQLVFATQGGGFGQRVQLSSDVAGFLGACDGELSVGQIVTAMGVLSGRSGEDVWRAVREPVEVLCRAGMLQIC
ncbi:MAG: methyltransferase [Actinomycetaceae bacterium]|nr:methyltransferase [Actinomycetaceae bacterium]